MTGLFPREFVLPSHDQDRRAHEQFLLDTYADRRADAEPSLLRRMLVTLGVR